MPRRGISYQDVIDAAARLANIHGLDQLTLAMLAADLRIRTPSLYNHVEGLAGVQRGLAARGIADLTTKINRALLGKTGTDAVRVLAHTYRDYIVKSPGVYTATSLVPQLIEPGDALEQASTDLVGMMSTILATVAAIPEESRIHAVRAFRSAVHGFATLQVAQSFGLPVDINASFDWLIDTFIAGLVRS